MKMACLALLVVVSVAVQMARPASADMVANGTKSITDLVKKVKQEVPKLQTKLDAAVKAGKLNPADISAVSANLASDLTQAQIVEVHLQSALLSSINSCKSPWWTLVQACMFEAIIPVILEKNALQKMFEQHKESAQRLTRFTFYY